MPICTTCTHPTPYLYTVYESEYNLRLEQCPKCLQFVDPYVEHDSLTILLDLFLLKRGVYRHLLYNTGAEPRRLTGRSAPNTNAKSKLNEQEEGPEGLQKPSKALTWVLIIKLGLALTVVDAFIRWSYLNASVASPASTTVLTPWTKETLFAFLRVFLGTSAETIAFHGGITLTCYIVMRIIEIFHSFRPPPSVKSSIRQQFHLSLISLSLFYSSLTKLFLLFLLTIWLPTTSTTPPLPKIDNPLPEWAKHLWLHDNGTSNPLTHLFEILDDDKLDREWVVRNVVGGMSAGFGLRVILDIHLLFTTIIILSGWVAKTAVATLVSRWVGEDELAREAWLAYSIP
ncbi:Arv1-like family-domain-containing protein [Gymnopilus junonius]|uniref:Protein ARV n=1 Tax=Gymnopilus junonius TaxID=109634 RepID=A0A9P5NHF9_GYMJU|nr:Arv1-like family-domain-containing protein [Gymnopilus junonius]